MYPTHVAVTRRRRRYCMPCRFVFKCTIHSCTCEPWRNTELVHITPSYNCEHTSWQSTTSPFSILWVLNLCVRNATYSMWCDIHDGGNQYCELWKWLAQSSESSLVNRLFMDNKMFRSECEPCSTKGLSMTNISLPSSWTKTRSQLQWNTMQWSLGLMIHVRNPGIPCLWCTLSWHHAMV